MKKLVCFVTLVSIALLLVSCGTYNSVHDKPVTTGYDASFPVVQRQNDSTLQSGNNFLLKNKHGLWELYVEGDPLQRGMVTGALSEELIHFQEGAFFDKVKDIVPSKFKQKMLRQFLKWYNRKLYLHVEPEYKTEIYGLSRHLSHDYDYVAPAYLRSLYLHAAHDIGHALTDLSLVGCTSFAVWGDKTEDGSLLIARNLDFYVGDEFAKNKLVSFVKPTTGYPFMSVGWGGMIGVLSGMNTEGLTVTINSGKSDMPLVAKTPISLLTRQILQYAKNIEEAIAIAKKHEVFVSESIMVGSANDNKTILIEVSPDKFGVYEVANTSQLVCSNHFQSDAYKDDHKNNYAIKNSHTEYRFERMTELLGKQDKINPEKAAAIMRNTKGLSEMILGYGNEKAINQLLAHHSVIFRPEERQVWVSANPYQLGEYVAYDLDEIFSQKHNGNIISLGIDSLAIPQDEFVNSQEYKNYEAYRVEDHKVDLDIKNKTNLESSRLRAYQALNPDFWVVYYKAGVYFYNKGYYTAAQKEFEKALTKEITTLPDKEKTEEYLKKISKKLN